MFDGLITTWFELVRDWGYAGVVGLMALESSVFPVPSEVVVPPAGYWAHQGTMSFWLVVLAGTAGSWIGAACTYWVARWLGRPAIARWGRWIGCGPDKVERAEHLLGRYATAGVFFCRLLPVVRHVVGIPAGILRVPFLAYSLATIAGSFLWCIVLAWFGWRFSERHPGAIGDPKAFVLAMKAEALWVALACLVLVVLYVLMLRLTTKRKEAT